MSDEKLLPRTRAEIIERMALARQQLEQTFAHLSDEQISAWSTSIDWSVKDHLAHLAVWAAGIGALLRRQPRYARMGVDEQTYLGGDEDAINEVIYQQHKDEPLSAVRAMFDQAHRDVIVALDDLSDGDLARTYSYYQPDEPGEDSGQPITKWVVGNTYEHYTEHQPWIEARLQRDVAQS